MKRRAGMLSIAEKEGGAHAAATKSAPNHRLLALGTREPQTKHGVDSKVKSLDPRVPGSPCMGKAGGAGAGA